MTEVCKSTRLLQAPNIHFSGTPRPGKFMPVENQGKVNLASEGVMRSLHLLRKQKLFQPRRLSKSPLEKVIHSWLTLMEMFSPLVLILAVSLVSATKNHKMNLKKSLSSTIFRMQVRGCTLLQLTAMAVFLDGARGSKAYTYHPLRSHLQDLPFLIKYRWDQALE